MPFTHKFTYRAGVDNFETSEPVTDTKLLAMLDGAQERTCGPDGFAVGPEELPNGIGLSAAIPRLRFDSGELFLEIELTTDRLPDDLDIEQLAAFCHRQIEGGWGMNYEFDFPEALPEHQVHFDSVPRERVPTPGNETLETILSEREWSYEVLEAMSNDELRALLGRLERIVSTVASKGWQLRQAVEAHLQQRRAPRR